jgi:hypothetical protein
MKMTRNKSNSAIIIAYGNDDDLDEQAESALKEKELYPYTVGCAYLKMFFDSRVENPLSKPWRRKSN